MTPGGPTAEGQQAGPAVEDLDDEIGPKDFHRFVTVLRGELAARQAAPAPAPPASAPEQRRPDPVPEPPEGGGFGIRAERLLRLAEAEAREIRGKASGEATALVERARADAERLRHEAEQSLIERSAAQDREHATRMTELVQREEHVAEQLAASERTAEEARAAVRRDIEAMRAQAQAELDRERELAAAEMARRTERAGQEVERLQSLAAAARSELRRLADVLVGQLDGVRPGEG